MRRTASVFMPLSLRIPLICGLVAVLVLVATSAMRRTPAPLARAGAVTVNPDAFKQAYGKWLMVTGVSDASERRLAFLKDMIGTRLAVLDARERGIENEAHYQFRAKHLARKLLLDLYVQCTRLDTLTVTDNEVRSLYARANTQVTARHLHARSLEGAQKLHARLLAGEDFESLAQEVFMDPRLRDTGGLLPPFTFDETDASFEDAAFNLPIGEISEPVRTAQGYSIIRVENRFTRPIITESEFAARRDAFTAFALERKRNVTRRELALGVVDQSAIHFYDAAVQALLARILHGNPERETGLMSWSLLSFGTPRVTWTVADFRDRARYASDRQRAQVRTESDLKEFAGGLVASEIMLQHAQDLKRRPEYAAALREALDRYVADHLLKSPGVEAPETELRAYYDNAPRTEFMRPAQVQLAWQSFDSEAKAASVTNLPPDTPSGYFEAEELGTWARAVFEAQEGELLGPYQTATGWVRVRVGPQRPPSHQSFKDARATIEAILREANLRASRRALFDSLSAHYNLKIDIDRVKLLPLDT